MRKNIISIIMLLGLVAIPTSSDAQFLKQLGKALESAGKGMLQGSTGQQGASVQFSNLRLTYDQKDASNGRTMLQLHYTLKADGLQGHKLVPILAVEIPQGTLHKFSDGNDMKQIGNELTCSYQSTTFNGQWQAIYIDALNPLPGKQTYYACIYIADKTTNQVIARSDYKNFTNTGKQKEQLQDVRQSAQQSQTQQQKRKASEHMTFQDIPMGQSEASIKVALKQKGFKDDEYVMTGTLNGASVAVWIADDGSSIKVSEEKGNTKALAKKRFLQLKTNLMETYHGITHPWTPWDDSEGAIISTDKGYIEVFYRDADEVNFSGDYICEYIYKDKASMSSKDIAIESSYPEGDVISAETAIELYKSKDESLSADILEHLGYFHAGEDSKGYTYWCRNCSLTKTLKPTAFGKGTSSVVRYCFKGQPDVRVQVFNEKAVQSFYDQLEKLGYGWQGTGSGTGALEWKKDMTDQSEKSFWLISEKGYFYQQHGGYFLILGGNIE